MNDGLFFKGLMVYRSGVVISGLRQLRTRTRKDGYVTFKHKGKTYYLHRVVCEVYHGPPPTPDAEAHHGDNDRGNNRDTNLSWKTPAENKALRQYPNRRTRKPATAPTHPELKRLHEESNR